MPKTIIAEGKTSTEAIEKGLEKLNATKNMVEIKTIEEEKKRSFYSILAPRVVKIEMTLKEDFEKFEKTIKKPKRKRSDCFRERRRTRREGGAWRNGHHPCTRSGKGHI